MTESTFYNEIEKILTSKPTDFINREKLISFLNAAGNQKLNIQSMDYVFKFNSLGEKESKTLVTEPYYFFVQTGISAVSNYHFNNVPKMLLRNASNGENLFGGVPTNLQPINELFTWHDGIADPKDFLYIWGDRAYMECFAENPSPGIQPGQNLYVILTGFKFYMNGLA